MCTCWYTREIVLEVWYETRCENIRDMRKVESVLTSPNTWQTSVILIWTAKCFVKILSSKRQLRLPVIVNLVVFDCSFVLRFLRANFET